MSLTKSEKAKLKRLGLSGLSKPKRTPSHPTKSHVVAVRVRGKVKIIRFGQQGAKTAGKPKPGKVLRQKPSANHLRIDIGKI
tara:strand:+ start:57 stop:302 length:246 start_codon:yes stop_codon:yes gene_type:complete